MPTLLADQLSTQIDTIVNLVSIGPVTKGELVAIVVPADHTPMTRSVGARCMRSLNGLKFAVLKLKRIGDDIC